MFEKLVSFTKKVSDLADKPSLNASELKAQFDAAPDEVRTYLNKLIDALTKTTSGDSGAKNVGATNISGLTGSDVQSLLESLNSTINGVKQLPARVPITPVGGWSNAGGRQPLTYWVDAFGVRHLEGDVTGGTSTAWTVFGTIPLADRPKVDRDYTVQGYTTNNTPIGIRVLANGNIAITSGNPASIGSLYIAGVDWRVD